MTDRHMVHGIQSVSRSTSQGSSKVCHSSEALANLLLQAGIQLVEALHNVAPVQVRCPILLGLVQDKVSV